MQQSVRPGYEVFGDLIEEEQPSSWSDIAMEVLSFSAAKSLQHAAHVPMDHITLLIQHQSVHSLIRNGKVQRYEGGVFAIAKRLVNERGTTSLWKGTCARVLESVIVHYASHALVSENIWEKLPAGLKVISPFLLSLSLQPLRYISFRLVADSIGKEPEFSGMVDVVKKTLERNGVSGLYSGGLVVLSEMLVQESLFFLFFTVGFRALDLHETDESLAKALTKLALAFVFYSTIKLAIFPFQLVANRLMLQGDKPVEKREYKSVFGCVRSIYKEEGIKGFYKGFGLNMLGAIIFTLLRYD